MTALTPVEDRFSVLLSRLEGIEKSLRTLREIEANTRASDELTQHVFRDVVNEKITVNIRCSIITVGDIDTVKQEFSCDIYVSATWREPRLQGKTENEEIDWRSEWNPRIVFFNAVSIDSNQKNRRLFYTPGEDIPFAQETYRLVGTFKENLELMDFPLDCQELTITLMSDWTDKMVEFQKDMFRIDNVRHETFTAVQEWDLGDHVATKSISTKDNQASSANNYPMYHMRCHVKRKNGYYLWNVALIMFLIGALSFSSFSVTITEPADRLGVTLTLLLTAVAFKFVVSQSLPTISYLTLLDKYVLAVMVFLCGIALENAVAAALPDAKSQSLFDRVCLFVFLGIFSSLHIIALVIIIVKKKYVAAKMHNYSKDYKIRAEQINNLQRVREEEFNRLVQEKDDAKNSRGLVYVASGSTSKQIKTTKLW